MTIFVGSHNPVKINAVKIAAQEKWPTVQVLGYDVPSLVSAQPITDEETATGAHNRAAAAMEAGLTALPKSGTYLAIGMEGGVMTDGRGQMWSTVWAVVLDQQGHFFEANGARVKVPSVIAEQVAQGQEMGPVMQRLTGESDVRSKQGMFGIITHNFITRTEEYAGIAKMALGLWYGQGWDDHLKSSST